MSKINKIRLSGTDYDIQDVSATSVVELTQQQYDDLPASAKTDNILYIITDSTVDYVTSAQTQSAINQAVSGKQDTLVSSVNIKTINNESILGSGNIDIQGGGKAIEAGRGIAITTGETADTVSFNLPISAGTGTNSVAEGENTYANGYASHAEGYDTIASGKYSHAEGSETIASGWGTHAEGNSTSATSQYSHAEGGSTKASGAYSHAEGYNTTASGNYSHTEGNHTKTTNESEHASGKYNVSSSASTTFGDSGNTLFSVGNGTGNKARHNAFEIRQNGDIYLTKDGQDVKLQDQLGGGNSVVELTQAAYDVLVTGGTVDPDTFYIITDAQAGDLTNYYTKTETDNAITAATSTKQDTLVSSQNIKTINNESILGSGNIDIQGGGGGVNVVQTTGTSTTDVMSQNAVTTQFGGYVTTDTEQIISGRKVFTYSSSDTKAIEFKQTSPSNKVGFRVTNSADTNNELASFEFRPNTFAIDGVQHPLLYFGHYRNTNTANAGVPQTVIGYRQYDQLNAAAYHYLIPLPKKAKTPFNLTTTFKDYYAPIGFKNGSTMITADNTGVVDLSSELGGLKLVKLTQSAYDALAPNYDSNTLYIING